MQSLFSDYSFLTLAVLGILAFIAGFHTLGAFALTAFFAAHVYLTTTGHTPTSNLKAMVTGYEEIKDGEHSKAVPTHSAEKELVES